MKLNKWRYSESEASTSEAEKEKRKVAAVELRLFSVFLVVVKVLEAVAVVGLEHHLLLLLDVGREAAVVPGWRIAGWVARSGGAGLGLPPPGRGGEGEVRRLLARSVAR